MCKNYIASFGKHNGEMSEWLKEHAWKACVRETVPRVRIPLSPPFFYPKFIDRKIERWEMGLAQRGPVNLVRSGRKQR